MTAESLSAELTSLPCSIRMSRHSNVRLATLVAEARRLSFNVSQCVLFVLFCHGLLTMLLLGGQVALLPPVLTGLEVRGGRRELWVRLTLPSI